MISIYFNIILALNNKLKLYIPDIYFHITFPVTAMLEEAKKFI